MRKKIKKAVWLSYDLGIGGDYPGLYKWLDNHNAIECGNSVAFFYYMIDNETAKNLPQIVYDDLNSNVDLRSGDRLYVIWRDMEKVKGIFMYGRRRGNPWKGYGDIESSENEEGE